MPRPGRFGLPCGGLFQRPRRRPTVHFLHVGKCGGTAIKDLAARITAIPDAPRIVGHGHSRKLADLPASEPYFFSVRDPISRFFSAFYMRKRKEQPRLYREWTDGEREAYGHFPEANDLAESLFDDSPVGAAAFSAMQSIGHLSYQHAWFKIRDLFAVRQPLCILRQERLQDDIARLLRLLGVDEGLALPTDRTRAHRNDYAGVPPLSEAAIRNLRKWYAVDLEYYRLVNEWVEARDRDGAAAVAGRACA